MRIACINCCIKHIAKAAVTATEVHLGYPNHIIYVIGNLSEAEDEILMVSPELANRIRKLRLAYMDDLNYNIETTCEDLVEDLIALRTSLGGAEPELPKEAILP